MEKLHSHRTISILPLQILLIFFSLHLPSSAYTPPSEYFINCGSETNINATRRNFVGDLNSDSISFTKQSTPVKDSNQSQNTSSLYQTARIFRQTSSYEFNINNNGTYLVRLHFFAFSSPTNLSTALFNVSASGFSLLQNFTVQNSSNAPIIKEFLVSIPVGKFSIYFTPHGFSFAFVNALEVFLAPDSFIPDEAPHISPTGNIGSYNGILSQVLQTIHRINVGGLTITPDNDTLWRNWVPDDSYLYSAETAVNSKVYTDMPKYVDGGASEYTAPDFVYRTAKEMKIDTSRTTNNFNITWSFHVSKNARHFVRVHFCDIISTYLGGFDFNLYISSNYGEKIDPYEKMGSFAAPFYIDFVVDSDDSGLLNISIGPNSKSIVENAFLNGLEIMGIMEGSVPITIVSKNKHIILVIGSVLGGFGLISILAILFLVISKRRKPKPKLVETLDWSPKPDYRGGSSHSKGTQGTITGSPLPNLNLGLKISFTEIQFAIDNFNSKLLVGKGGFGNVYGGTLRNGMKVAVKRSEPGSGQGLPEFQTEIMVLSKIRHRHLVSLIGYCDERSEMILVYEFMEKGTLRDHLYNSKFPSLFWKQRLEICIGAAKGLDYLHRGSAGGIIHRDVKSTNILLDENHVAKVADFGLSRLGPPDQTHVSTCVKGTFGYLDPEYFRTQQLTEKSDVYSFGVVLLEVLCARPAINPMLPSEQANLAEWALLCMNKGMLEDIIDPSIKSQINPNSLRKFSETAEKCLQEYAADRPNMGDVLWDLEYALLLQQTASYREPHEDSATNVTSALAFPNVQRIPSLSMSMERDDMPIRREDSFISSESEVFSQLRIDAAR